MTRAGNSVQIELPKYAVIMQVKMVNYAHKSNSEHYMLKELFIAH